MLSVSVWLLLVIISAQVSPQSELHTSDASEAGVAVATYSNIDLPAAYFKHWKIFFIFIQNKRSGLRLSHPNPWLRVSKRPNTLSSLSSAYFT